MTKKRQTRRELTRRQLARREREQRTQRLVTWIAAAVGVVIVAILAYGSISELVQARAPVVRIGDNASITAREFRARQAYERWMTELEVFRYQTYIQQLQGQQEETPTEGPQLEGETEGSVADGSDALLQQLQFTVENLERRLSPEFTDLFAGQVLDAMIEEELVRREAEARGLTATEQEIERGIELTLGYDREAATSSITETDTITGTGAADLDQPTFEELYEDQDTNVLKVTRLPESDFREMIRAQVLGEELREVFADDVETVRDQVELIVFTVESEEDGLALQSRINDDGEDPGALVDAFAEDDNTETSGFELPYLPIEFLEAQLGTIAAELAFSTPVGQASEPVLGAGEQTFVVYVVNHEERELSNELVSQAEADVYNEWLSEQRDELVEFLAWEEAIVAE